jgi:hypothetical protein
VNHAARRQHSVVHLDDIEALPGPATLTWRPVRASLTPRTPIWLTQELYFVHRGRATFTVDGETIDAPAGTYVFVPDPASHRHAVAAEGGTTVVSFGGPPTFEPSA